MKASIYYDCFFPVFDPRGICKNGQARLESGGMNCNQIKEEFINDTVQNIAMHGGLTIGAVCADLVVTNDDGHTETLFRAGSFCSCAEDRFDTRRGSLIARRRVIRMFIKQYGWKRAVELRLINGHVMDTQGLE